MSKSTGPSVFDLKSANLPLLQLVLKANDLSAISAEFKKRYSSAQGFFDNDPIVIELGKLPKDSGPVDFKGLKRLLRPYKLVPIAFSGENAEQLEAAQEAGLVRAPDAQVALAAEPARAPAAASAAPPAPVAPPAPAQAEFLPPMVIDRPVRSGQQIYARNRDLIILATVNAGAEVIADGNIHVYGQLRGKALAGARGNLAARIFTTHLSPELVSVAGMYRTSEKPLPIDVAGKAAQVLLSGDNNLVMTPLGG